MWSDLDSINSTFIDNSRLGIGEGLKGLVRSKSKGNPTVVALRGSDLIRKSSPAAMAAAVYSKQQEDLKLPEEARQKKFGEGGVGDHLQWFGRTGQDHEGLWRRLRLHQTERPREDRGARAPQGHVGGHVRGRGSPSGPAADAAGRRPGLDNSPLPPPALPPSPPPNEIP